MPSSRVIVSAPSSVVTVDRHDLAVEAALVGGARRALVRLDRERVVLLAGDAPLLGDQLGRDALRHEVRVARRSSAGRTGSRTCRRRPTRPSARGSCSRRRPRSRRRTRRRSRPARRSARPAATNRTGGRRSCRRVDSGKPAASAALRPMLMPCSPTCMTQPMITSSTSAGSRSLRSTSARSTCAARSTGCTSFELAVAAPERACGRRRR